MAVYTCYDMIEDCRHNRPAGWRFFVSRYAPVLRTLIEHYGCARPLPDALARLARPDSPLFAARGPVPERQFALDLREAVLGETAADAPRVPLDLDTLGEALAPLPLVARQAAWLEAMHYSPEQAGRMLNASAPSVAQMREKAGELLRGKVDAWTVTILADNGRQLEREARERRGERCLGVALLLDFLDGRTTWAQRADLEAHLAACWTCIAQLCHVREASELLRAAKPLNEAETAPLQAQLGVGMAKRAFWRRA